MSSVNPRNAADRLERVLAGIENPTNRATCRRYMDERLANGKHPSTLAYELTALRDLAHHLGDVRFEDATREHLARFTALRSLPRTWRNVRKDGTATITTGEATLAESTKAVRRGVVKAFYRWLRGTDTYPPEVAWIRTTRPGNGEIPTDELVTPEDLKVLLQACPHPRDRALLAVLFEGGFRAGEVCALHVGSVTFDEYGAVLTLPKGAAGLKTGARRVRLLDAAPYLHAWFEAHPRKADRAAPLFPIVGDKNTGQRLSPDDVWYFTTSTARRAGLKKHLNPHLFRHTAATNAARAGWTEAMMRAYFGWSKGSDMPATYVHLAGKDYEDMLLEQRGLKQKGEGNGRPALAPFTCRSCGAGNMITAMFCTACRKPLNPEAEAHLREGNMADFKEELARMVSAAVREQLQAAAER
jgi:integrase